MGGATEAVHASCAYHAMRFPTWGANVVVYRMRSWESRWGLCVKCASLKSYCVEVNGKAYVFVVDNSSVAHSA